jgi:hypothetical protein
VVIERLPGHPGDAQVFIQVRLLFRQAEPQPFREYLVVAVAKGAVRVFRSQKPHPCFVAIFAGWDIHLTQVARWPPQ